ncbi:MAG: zinc ribbon domain-containing protein [Candidatus Helarchaeota archaeon]
MASKFKPWSTETELPNSDYTIQVGDVTGKWAVVIRKKLMEGGKKAIALKKIQKLTDTNIINVIKDTIGKEFSVDTFTLGSIMSKILREVYDKIKAREGAKTAAKAPQTGQSVHPIQPTQPTQPTTPTQTPDIRTQKSVEIPIIPKKRQADSFWSSYDAASSYTYPSSTPQTSATPQTQTTPTAPQSPPAQQYGTPPTMPAPAQAIVNSIPQAPPQVASVEGEEDLDDILKDLGVTCPFCGREIDPDDEICPYCGKKIPI